MLMYDRSIVLIEQDRARGWGQTIKDWAIYHASNIITEYICNFV